MTKIATWNVNSIKVRLPHILEWLQQSTVDILAIQETKSTDENFPVAEIMEAGYQVVFSGQKTYNGVAILSRDPANDIETDLPGLTDPQRRVLAATIGDIRVLDVYVPNGQSVESDKYQYKLKWLEALQNYCQQQLSQFEKFLVLGDFNIAPADADVHDAEAWAGKVLCSDPEREAFRNLLALGLTDSFRQFTQEAGLYSWWDYRAAAFRRDMGLRIDHILLSSSLAKAAQNCWIDKAPRKWERPSDHTPVVVELA